MTLPAQTTTGGITAKTDLQGNVTFETTVDLGKVTAKISLTIAADHTQKITVEAEVKEDYKLTDVTGKLGYSYNLQTQEQIKSAQVDLSRSLELDGATREGIYNGDIDKTESYDLTEGALAVNLFSEADSVSLRDQVDGMLRQLREQLIDNAGANIVLDSIGFSRGAAANRAFINEVNEQYAA